MLHAKPSRRDLLLSSAALVVGFSVNPLSLAAAAPDASGKDPIAKPVTLEEVDSFLAIDPQGAVTVYSGKVELGTGLRTALMQIVAEELDLPLDKITLIEGDTALTPDQGVTFGSLSVQKGGMQLRMAAATARAALLQLAATKLGTDVSDLTIDDGVIASKTHHKTAGFGELLSDRHFALKLDAKAALKDPKTYKIVGKSVHRVDIPDKVVGAFTYMQDVRVPGMLHGRVVRPPAIGATLQSVDDSSISDIKGARAIRAGNFLAVAADTEWAAIKASQKLKAQWSDWQGLPDQKKVFESVRATKIVRDDVTSKIGDAAAVLQSAPKRIKASYEFGIHTHGSIGPSCAIAQFDNGKLVCWSASQGPHKLREQLATMFGMPQTDVRVIYVEGSGCYGRNGHEDAAADAALLAHVTGKPVRVQWSRADEHGWDPKGPPVVTDLEAAFDANGKVVAWSGEFLMPDGAGGGVKLIAADLAGMPHETQMAPGNIINDTAIPYAFPNIHTVARRLADTPLRPGWIRTPGRMQNTFANETFMDEIAAAVGADPLQFRIDSLTDPRGIELLKRLIEVAKWEARPSGQNAQQGDVVTGRGVSYVKYELVRTYAGVVADVTLNRKTGDVRVTRVTVVHDCGQIINPDGVRNQIDGNVIQTTSRTLKEEVSFDRSHVTSLDWASYPIITFPEVPEVVIDLIDRPETAPWGVGEITSAVIPSAISNAIYDAAKIRMRSVPFTAEKVRAALAG